MSGRAPEPIRSTVAGVELVTIPVAHYAELLACWQQLKSEVAQPARQPHAALKALDPRSRLFGDPDVAIFLYDAFGRSKLKDAHAACVDRFGRDRSPSRATISRYWDRLR